jgi:hypothetical protein
MTAAPGAGRTWTGSDQPGGSSGRPPGRGSLAGFLGVGSVVVGSLWAAGCGSSSPPRSPTSAGDRQQPSASVAAMRSMREQLLAGAVSVLGSLDRYDESRASEQVFDRLVQWSHAAEASAERQIDPLLNTLPAQLRETGAAILDRDTFDAAGDVIALRDRKWLADVAAACRGDAVSDLDLATALFEWTVRSLAPVSDPPMVPGGKAEGSRWFLPGEIMLAGRGSGPQRAWIFIELLRQAGLDGVMLATPGTGGGPPRPWLPALISGGEAYLFEPTYGMPVPGPAGEGVATVRQAAADPAILEALAVPGRPYPVRAADLESVGILVVADPWNLSRRMARLDGDLAPLHGVRVAVAAEAVADRAAAAVPGGERATRGLWAFPWETVARRSLAASALADELGPLEVPLPKPGGEGMFRPLFAGRVREFRGDLAGPNGAKAAYMAARPSRRMIADAVASLPEQQAAAINRRLARIKEDATYWLGLVMLGEGEFAAAEDYLRRMTLEAAPDSRWTDAARINLAAALVGLGKPAEAAVLLREDGSPQRFGSRLLAERLAGEPGL